MLGNAAEQAGSLSLTAGVGTVTDCAVALLANETRVVEEPLATKLIGDADVVDGFLDFGHVGFFIGIEKVESLIEKCPEAAAAEFAGFAELELGIDPVGFWREFAELGDGDGSADVFPVVAVK